MTISPQQSSEPRDAGSTAQSHAEHVIFRYHPGHRPAICCHSIPHGCTGHATTLQDARRSFRSQMRLLGVDRHGLPSVVEHIEGMVASMWVRTRIGAVHRDDASGRMFLQTLLTSGQPLYDIRALITSLATDEHLPTVVIVEPDDPISVVLDQLTPRGVVVVVHPDPDHVVESLVLYGPQAGDAHTAAQALHLSGFRDMTVEALSDIHLSAGCPVFRVHDDCFTKPS